MVFEEAGQDSTNALGVMVAMIGSIGELSSVNWATGPFYLQVEMDVTGGSDYLDMGTEQLLSVPYALFAANSPAGSTGATGPQGPTGPAGGST